MTQPTLPLPLDEAALIAEACNRSDVLWVRPAGRDRPQAVWHVWHASAICLVHGEGEQSLELTSGPVEVTVRSKDIGSRLLRFTAVAESPSPGSDTWRSAAGVLALKRLNAPDPGRLLDRWAAGAVITLLHPQSPLQVSEGLDGAEREDAPAPRGPGTTLTRRPYHLGGRKRRASRRG